MWVGRFAALCRETVEVIELRNLCGILVGRCHLVQNASTTRKRVSRYAGPVSSVVHTCLRCVLVFHDFHVLTSHKDIAPC